MCSIYFIVTGIQFWMTEYLVDILQVEPVTVNLVFSLCSVTAPLLGVLVGGTIADRYGGYKGKNTARALKMCVMFGFVSFCFAFPMGFLYQLIYLVVLLWTFLFFGAAIIPIGTGVMISSVPKDCQATSSSLSQLIFNLGGYFFAPMLTGFVMDSFINKRNGFVWGMRVVFWWVIISLIMFLISYYVAYSQLKKDGKELPTENSIMVEDEELAEDWSEMMKLEIRRRLAQTANLI